MKNILVSVSGGRTSGYMAAYIKRTMPDENLLFVFANTGQEHPKTIEFLKNLDRHFGLGLVCVEAVVHHGERAGTTHKVVDINSLHMGGDLFRAMCAKYGLPNKDYPHCNRELKLAPIHSYAKQHFGSDDYDTAIGIRADEIDRMSTSARERRIFYPLVKNPTIKAQIHDWWKKQPFDLEIPEHHGNCLTCWKKSDRKLKTIATDNPEWFDLFRELERDHGWSGYVMDDQTEPRKFFRRYRSVDDIFTEAKHPFVKFTDGSAQMGLFAADEDIPCTLDCGID